MQDFRSFIGARSVRVIRSGGRLALHEIMEGPAGNVRYPVFWAGNESISFLEQPDAIHELLMENGYSELEWNEVVERALELARKRHDETTETGPPSLGLNVIVPRDVPQKGTNSFKNLEEERIVVVQAVLSALDSLSVRGLVEGIGYQPEVKVA